MKRKWTISQDGLQEHMHPHLDYDEQTDSSTHLRGLSIHASHHVHDGLADGYNHSKHCNTTATVTQLTSAKCYQVA